MVFEKGEEQLIDMHDVKEETIWCPPQNSQLWTPCNWPQCHITAPVQFPLQVLWARL